MSDREILEKFIDPENSCLTDKEKKEVMNNLYKYKEAFSFVKYGSADLYALYYLNCLGDQCHVYYYWVHCATQLLNFEFTSLCTLRWYIGNITWLISTIITLY